MSRGARWEGARALRRWTMLRMQRTIWCVVLLSRPVLISSISSVLQGPTTISPARRHMHGA